MSAIAERLHAVAHRAAMAGRDLDDSWPSPLETTLAATTLLKHGQAYREDAERAINRALRWWQDEMSSETSGDAAALALLARACHETQRTNTGLTAAAVAAVEKLTHQPMQSLPVLHLFLAAWGLSELVPDRHSSFWTRLNDQVARASKLGVDQPLATLTL
jgi:uncharacterized protein YfaS (alpha-2-macroglobulin family)